MAIEVPMFRADSLEDTRYAIFFVAEILADIQEKEKPGPSCSSCPGFDRQTNNEQRCILYLGGRGPKSTQVGNHNGVNPASRLLTRLPPPLESHSKQGPTLAQGGYW